MATLGGGLSGNVGFATDAKGIGLVFSFGLNASIGGEIQHHSSSDGTILLLENLRGQGKNHNGGFFYIRCYSRRKSHY